MAKEKREKEHKQRNKFSASLATVIVMFIVSILETTLYIILQDDDDSILAMSIASLAIAIFLLVWFICLAAKHKKVHGATIVFVGILALSWLVSSVPLFSGVISNIINDYSTSRSYSFSIIYFDFAAYVGETRVDLTAPYSNFILSGVLLLIAPCIFSNEHICLKAASNPETEAIVSPSGELKKVDHSKNRYKFALTMSVILCAYCIFEVMVVFLGNMYFAVFFDWFVVLVLICLFIVMLSLRKRVNPLATVIVALFAVLLFVSSLFIARLSEGWSGFGEEEKYTTELHFYFVYAKAIYSGYKYTGEWLVTELTQPYPDLSISIIFLLITSILFGVKRKKILASKKESPELNE